MIKEEIRNILLGNDETKFKKWKNRLKKEHDIDLDSIIKDAAKQKVKKIKWDERFLELARHVSKWSKDPSTQTGAVIVDTNNRIVSLGYNGFPQAIKDLPERYNDRELKYKMIVHCEMNALLFADTNITGYTLYTYPFASCSRCAVHFIQAGIGRCVAPSLPEYLQDRWSEDIKLTEKMFDEAGIKLDYVELNE